MHPERRRTPGRAIVSLILGLLVSLIGPAAFAATSPNTCGDPRVPVDSIGMPTCPQVTTPPPRVEPPDAQAGEKGNAAGDQPGVKFGEEEEPTGWAGPIAKDLGQGVQGLASDLARALSKDGLLPKFEFSRAYLTLYSIMFGLGVMVAMLATMVAAVKAADAKGVDSRMMARQALARLLLFSPVAAATPLFLAQVGELARALAGGFFDMAAAQMASQLTWLAQALAVGAMGSVLVPGGSAVMVGLFLFLLASLVGIWLELAISHYLVFLLALLIPILFAASINPGWRGGVKKVTGGLLGAFLAPAALFVVWVVALAGVAPWNSDNGFFTRAGVLIVSLLLSLAAPIAIGMVLSYVVPAFADGHRYDTGSIASAVDRVRQRRAGLQSAGPRGSRAKRASEVTDKVPPTPVEKASGVGAGSSGSAGASPAPAMTTGSGGAVPTGAASAGTSAVAAAGPVGAAAMVWGRLVNRVRGTAEATRDTVAASASSRARDGAGQGSAPAGAAQPPTTPAAEPATSGRRGPGPRGSEGSSTDHPGPRLQPPGTSGATTGAPAAQPSPAGSRSRGADAE